MHQRRVRREKQKDEGKGKPQEKAARLTAVATVWIAAFTVVLAAVGMLLWSK